MISAPHPTTTPPSPSGSRRRANALPSGHLLDEYRVEAILGAGGFGVTYKALDTHLETWVAIKEYFPVEWSFRDADGVTVHPNTQGQTSALEEQESDYLWGLERFLDEARVLAQIQHPYVVRVKRYFRAHGTAYIVMDFEEGEPLSAILRDDEILDESQIRGLLEDVLPALQAVHDQGYLHRDLKPANLYLRSTDHRVMLIDFGAARVALGRHSKSVTSLVTPGYSPPEQYTTRNDRYGTWTDVYALGAVLYRCVTGRVPMEAAERLLDDSMEPAIRAGAGRYSTNLLRVIDRALAVRPEERLRTVAEMRIALGGARGEDSDETVIVAPISLKPGAPAGEAGRLPLTSRPVPPMAEQGIDVGSLEITQPPVDHPPPVSSRRAVPRLSKPAGVSGRLPPLRLLMGGVAVAALAALLVWFWPSTPVPEPTPPPYSFNQPDSSVERTADRAPGAPDPSAASVPEFAPPEATVDASPAESSGVVEPFPLLEPDLESRVSTPLAEAPTPEMAALETDFVVTEPDASDPELARDVEPESLPELDDAIARSLPDSSDRDAADLTESAAEPAGSGIAGALPAPAPVPAARPPSGAASKPVADRKPPPRRATSQSRPRKAGQGKTELRPIVITPPEWREQSRARASGSPRQSPSDMGFNQK